MQEKRTPAKEFLFYFCGYPVTYMKRQDRILHFIVANKKEICYSKFASRQRIKGLVALNDKEVMRAIRLIVDRGNNAEVRRKRDGTLTVYEVKKNIVTSGKSVLDKSE